MVCAVIGILLFALFALMLVLDYKVEMEKLRQEEEE